jgi:hypothetical protein
VSRTKQIAERTKGDGRASSLSNLQITAQQLEPDYQLLEHHDLTRGETGLLRVFSLIPKTAGKPSFAARVDDGSPGKRRQPELDIDMKDATKALERDFKANRNGYFGHHTDRSPNQNQRIFDVEVGTPAGKVFAGEVSFNVAFSVAISVSASSSVSVGATVNRANLLLRMRNFLSTIFEPLRRWF